MSQSKGGNENTQGGPSGESSGPASDLITISKKIPTQDAAANDDPQQHLPRIGSGLSAEEKFRLIFHGSLSCELLVDPKLSAVTQNVRNFIKLNKIKSILERYDDEKQPEFYTKLIKCLYPPGDKPPRPHLIPIPSDKEVKTLINEYFQWKLNLGAEALQVQLEEEQKQGEAKEAERLRTEEEKKKKKEEKSLTHRAKKAAKEGADKCTVS